MVKYCEQRASNFGPPRGPDFGSAPCLILACKKVQILDQVLVRFWTMPWSDFGTGACPDFGTDPGPDLGTTPAPKSGQPPCQVSNSPAAKFSQRDFIINCMTSASRESGCGNVPEMGFRTIPKTRPELGPKIGSGLGPKSGQDLAQNWVRT